MTYVVGILSQGGVGLDEIGGGVVGVNHAATEEFEVVDKKDTTGVFAV